MKRLTIVLAKDENGKALNYVVYPDKENQRNANFKLGQYEDIEEEFQIDNFDDLRERLKTYKFLANHEMSCVDVEGYNCMLKDLKEYHDIEEEFGIDLSTLFKALKDGAIYTNKDKSSLVSLALVYSMSKKCWLFLDMDSIPLTRRCFSIKDINLNLKMFKEELL